ncbi:MAG TPA: GNAT family N-acetyltransferase [Capillimicrobium sp.]
MPRIVRSDASRLDDLEALWLALREHHLSVTEHWGGARDAREGWAMRRSVFGEILDEGGALLLALDGDGEDAPIVGFAICEREEGGGSPTWTWPEDFLAIVDLVVAADRRRQGIGDLLMAEIAVLASELGVAALDVNAAAPNDAARRFYERHGFRLDHVVYRKPL